MSSFTLKTASESYQTDHHNRSELQAIIIACGDDALLYPLTSAPELPKSLLPVGGVPLIWFQLSLLQQAGFEHVLIAVEEPFREAVSKSVEKFKERCTSKLGNLTIQLKSVAEQIGTADALRTIESYIKDDFIVLSGDMIIDNIVEDLANMHHLNNATVTMILNDTHARKKGIDGVNYIALAAQDGRVLKMINHNDLERETLTLPKAMLRRRPDIMVSTELVDMRCYIFSKWVIEYIVENEEISGITEDLIPALLNMQFRGSDMLSPTIRASLHGVGRTQRMASVGSMCDLEETKKNTRMEKNNTNNISTSNSKSNNNPNHHNNNTNNNTNNETKNATNASPSSSSSLNPDSSVSSVSSSPGSSSSSSSSLSSVELDVVKCHCLVLDSEVTYAARASTVDEYISMNQKLMKGPNAPRNTPFPNNMEALIREVGKNKRRKGTIIGEECTLPKKYVLKQSIVGSHCRIGAGVKLERCIVMDHVSIGAGAVLKGCIIASNVNIGERCLIEDTRAGPGTRFEDDDKVSREEIGKNL